MLSGKTKTIILLVFFSLPSTGQVKRGRNEGTFNIPASNVMGNGNIVLCTSISGEYSGSSSHIDPGLCLGVGFTEIMQISGRTSLTNFRTLGGTEGHVQVTLPENDHLRFFGIAVCGDLFLSTEKDTISGSATADRPEYHAYVRPSLIMDIDWIARFRKLPLKTYLNISMADNPDLLYLYSQAGVRLGTELKLNRHSFSIDIGAGWYKEKPRIEYGFNGDGSYCQQRLWMEPAIRYRLFDRISLLGAVRILIFQRVKSQHPLEPTYLRISTALAFPLMYRETNAEAIRTMLFVERHRPEKTDDIEASIRDGSPLEAGLQLDLPELEGDSTALESEQEVLKRREEIQKKMDEIEQLLKGLE